MTSSAAPSSFAVAMSQDPNEQTLYINGQQVLRLSKPIPPPPAACEDCDPPRCEQIYRTRNEDCPIRTSL